MYYNKLKYIRKSQKMTLEELGRRAGVSAGYICHLENGSRKHPSIEVMESIAKALNKTIFEIFFNEE